MIDQTHATALESPALLVALALILGMLAQTVARHLRVPGIVLLLGTGVLVGPDGLGIVEPGRLGDGLQLVLGFAVAIILFEGGMNLTWRDLRRQAASIRRLVTVGAVVTTVGGALAARWFLEWPWKLSLLFGTLVIVTGPTVVNPLLRRIRVRPKLATVLEAEGVFGDAVGAIVAVFALEAVIAPSRETLTQAAVELLFRFGIGGAIGLLGGLLLSWLLRVEWLIPEGLENVFTLAWVVFLYQGSNAMLAESGILSVIVCGVTIANLKTQTVQRLRQFKEQLTILFIGMLFVLLAADVRVAEVRSLGWPGLATVGLLMFVVRPVNVWVSTWRLGFEWRERAFLSWLAPRGIVAAAVASLCAVSLAEAGYAEARELRALVFLVIAVTVTLQGLTAGAMARLLRVRPKGLTGYVILGAEPLGLSVGEVCRQAGKDVVFVDSNAENCEAAETQGFRAFRGHGLDDVLLERVGMAGREGVLGLTTNENVNFAFARRACREHRVPRAWVALTHADREVRLNMIEDMGGRVLFGRPFRLERWSRRFANSEATVEQWQVRDPEAIAGEFGEEARADGAFLPIAHVRRNGGFGFVDNTTKWEKGDVVFVAIAGRDAAATQTRLEAAGLMPAVDS